MAKITSGASPDKGQRSRSARGDNDPLRAAYRAVDRADLKMQQDRRLKGGHLRVLSWLLAYAWKHAEVFAPSIETIAKEIGYCERQVQRLLQDMMSWEYIAAIDEPRLRTGRRFVLTWRQSKVGADAVAALVARGIEGYVLDDQGGEQDVTPTTGHEDVTPRGDTKMSPLPDMVMPPRSLSLVTNEVNDSNVGKTSSPFLPTTTTEADREPVGDPAADFDAEVDEAVRQVTTLVGPKVIERAARALTTGLQDSRSYRYYCGLMHEVHGGRIDHAHVLEAYHATREQMQGQKMIGRPGAYFVKVLNHRRTKAGQARTVEAFKTGSAPAAPRPSYAYQTRSEREASKRKQLIDKLRLQGVIEPETPAPALATPIADRLAEQTRKRDEQLRLLRELSQRREQEQRDQGSDPLTREAAEA
jgi:hypothetical protein